MGDVDWKLVLEFARVVLAWPPLALVAFAIFTYGFRREIGQFLANGRPRFPGIDLLPIQQPLPSTDQDARAALAAAEETDAAAASDGADGETGEPLHGDLHQDFLQMQEAAAARRQVEENYRNLNGLLALPTQQLLDAIIAQEPMAMSNFKIGMWPEMPPTTKTTMVTALYQKGLIRIEGNWLFATDRGREYAAWPERVAWVSSLASLYETPKVEPSFPRALIPETPFARSNRAFREPPAKRGD